MSGKKRSKVWLHFTDKGDKAVCRYCELEISTKKGNVSNLARHLKCRHPGIDQGGKNSVVFIQDEQPNLAFELEEDHDTKSEPEVTKAYMVRWTPKSELREQRRLRSSEGRVSRQRYVEQIETEEVTLAEMDETVPDETRPVKCKSSPMTAGPLNPPPSDDDSDRHFLLSLLPLMKQLSPEDNMDIRIQIQNSFKEKLFPGK